MSLSNEIRKLLLDNDITLTQMARVISEKINGHYTVQNLSQKIRKNKLNSVEIDIILDFLNYNVFFYPKNR